MELSWGQRHASIFIELVDAFREEDIRYFVLRNYEGLPEENHSKDVDIIVEPHKINKARRILLNTYKNNHIKYYAETVYGRVHCFVGMDTETQISIQVDLIAGYLSKGYEIFTFEELYEHTEQYRGFQVMDVFFGGIMLYIYKQFGYKKPKLKSEYQAVISKAYYKNPIAFETILSDITTVGFAKEICQYIQKDDYNKLLKKAPLLTKELRRYVWETRAFATLKNTFLFLCQKVDRIIFRYNTFAKVFAVMAPDGTGKTTFLDAVLEQLQFYYVNDAEDNRFTVYHFRPGVLPNLGAVGEKAGVMKQDTNFTDPHRAKPANPLSSLIRIAYYTVDYIIGWWKCVRQDVQFDRYSIFDRYSYDLIVDPRRTKLQLPLWIRKIFVWLTPQPSIVFCLDANPEVIYTRKQELTLEEITRQIEEYRRVVASNKKRFIVINAEQTPNQMAKEAVEILLDRFTKQF